MSMSALSRAWADARLPSEREHVTPYLWKHPGRFQTARIQSAHNHSDLRWTVDDARDLEFVRALYRRLMPVLGPLFDYQAVLDLLEAEPDLLSINRGTPRNEGYAISTRNDGSTAEP